MIIIYNNRTIELLFLENAKAYFGIQWTNRQSTSKKLLLRSPLVTTDDGTPHIYQ